MEEGPRHDQRGEISFNARSSGRRAVCSKSIEKLSKVSGAWGIVAALEEGGRSRLGAVVIGCKIYMFGDNRGGNNSTWNAFDVLAGQWASVDIPDENRRLPLGYFCGEAISVTSCLDSGKRITWDN